MSKIIVQNNFQEVHYENNYININMRQGKDYILILYLLKNSKEY